MSAPAFTPGPWHPGHLGQREGCQCAYVFSEGYHGSICTVSVGNDLPIGEGGNDAPPRDQAIANMHLMAAAPDLFKALETFVKDYVQLVESGDAGFWNPEEEPKVIAARAAISKAIPTPELTVSDKP